MTSQFTGRHMAGVLIAFFAVVIAVNVVMARFASSTFGGAVVDNSYVASQHFNRWLDEAARERTLGWRAEAKRLADARVEVTLSSGGAPVNGLAATARHPLGRLADRDLTFGALGGNRFVSRKPLPAGRWTLRLTASAGADTWRTEREIY